MKLLDLFCGAGGSAMGYYRAGFTEITGDLCMGQGLVGMAAYAAGRPFVGTELNKRRLANLLQKLAKKGAEVSRY